MFLSEGLAWLLDEVLDVDVNLVEILGEDKLVGVV